MYEASGGLAVVEPESKIEQQSGGKWQSPPPTPDPAPIPSPDFLSTEPDPVAAAIARLNDARAEIRREAIEALADLGPSAAAAVAPLLTIYADPTDDLWIEAATVVARMGTCAAPEIAKSLADPNPRVRQGAREMLGDGVRDNRVSGMAPGKFRRALVSVLRFMFPAMLLPSDLRCEWHYSIDEQTFGPVSLVDLRLAALSGKLPGTTRFWKPGFSHWQTHETLPKTLRFARPL